MKFWRCGSCDVKFEVRRPIVDQFSPRAAFASRCDCGLRFWSSTSSYSNFCTVGTLPEDLAEHKPNAEVLG